MPAPFDFKTLLSNPETFAIDMAGLDLQREFMSEAVVQDVPLTFDPQRAGRHLNSLLCPQYEQALYFALIPKTEPRNALIPLVILFNRPVPVNDMLESLSEAIGEEIRLCGGDPDKDLRQVTYYNRGTYGRLAAAGKLKGP